MGKINYPKHRKSPRKHTVKAHSRQGRYVRTFIRGSRDKQIVQIKRKSQKPFTIPVGHKVDKRFFPFIQDKWNQSYWDVWNYLRGKAKVLASAKDSKYTVKILDNYRVLFIKNDRPKEPVPMGVWMDFPEKEWGLTEKEYRELPKTERTKLEAKEQLTKWIDKEYYTGWLENYKPRLYEKMWFGGLSSFSAKHGIEATNRKLKPIVEKIWKEK